MRRWETDELTRICIETFVRSNVICAKKCSRSALTCRYMTTYSMHANCLNQFWFRFICRIIEATTRLIVHTFAMWRIAARLSRMWVYWSGPCDVPNSPIHKFLSQKCGLNQHLRNVHGDRARPPQQRKPARSAGVWRQSSFSRRKSATVSVAG